MRDALIIPARANEVQDHLRLLTEASHRLPLDQLVCQTDIFDTNPYGTGFVYAAPDGQEIHAVVDDPDVGRVEFAGQALAFRVAGLRTGASAHGVAKPYEPDLAGHVYRRPQWRPEERKRPSIQVAILGGLAARVDVDAEKQYLEVDGHVVVCFPEFIEHVVAPSEVFTGDIETMELEVRDCAPAQQPAELTMPDMYWWDWFQSQLWVPSESVGSPLTAQSYVEDIVSSHPEIASNTLILDRLKQHYFEICRAKGRPAKDDPFPEARNLQLSSAVDSQGENARLYSPYESLGRIEDYVAELELPDGSTRIVPTLREDEYWRRWRLNRDFAETGWRDWRNHTLRQTRRVRPHDPRLQENASKD